ncbi:patatin-like phospholipase family protein [Urbifossiella limnaea]|uniref:Patatin-like phospholipase n=1 Tax=Urbifossiella limnaea TaxID=2528023 RepID=A0A517XPN7_9BACT|nr:patatin-like phospholipase family protein [Urbifossiella limnaea]QDU19469.1 Patatin-like phospholipase [Urbifossiella limnaea]
MSPLTRVAAVGLVLAAAGCATRHRACAPPELTRESGLVQPGPADESAVVETELLRSLVDRTRAANSAPDPAAKPGKFLALSGGGMYGAYSVGVLKGWTDTGTRPTFDVVTGVSTGALVASYAFLGTAYDEPMTRLYTTVSDKDIYRRRPRVAVLFSDSAASSEPLKKLIAAQVDDALLAEVARAHAAGRRLYVGTTNLDARRLVVWDMGAIASSGRPDAADLYRTVLLASASVPGFFPPVPVEVEVNGRRFTELHVDGGATTGVFLRASTLHLDREALRAGRQPLAGSDAYVVIAGKLYADPACTDQRAVRIAAGSLESVVASQTRGELYRIYSLCLLGGMRYHLAAVPENFDAGGDAMSFDPAAMRRLYAAGYEAAAGGRAWRDTPPGAEPHEQTRPRTGTQFLAPGAR